ncbi:MAG: hypothetical protein O7G85_05570 [Planctomycetota bacterium]|nr:hypothetical protein [Planctomycetota bacterium]
MKIKGITIWEQYVEFFVLVLAAGVFVIFTALQFIGNPNAVTKGPDRYLPGTVDEILEEKANEFSGRLAEDAASPIDFDPHTPVLEAFQDDLTANISPDRQIARVQFHLPLHDVDFVNDAGSDFINPAISAPYKIVAKQSFDALLPSTVAFYPELQERFPQEPFDIAWITVAAKFNVRELLDQYATPGPDGELPFPDRWYDSRIDILDVKLERQVYTDGVWSNDKLMTIIPGQFSLREGLEEESVRAQERDRMLDSLAQANNQEKLIQPEFLATLGDWLPPNPEEEQITQDDVRPPNQEELEISRAQSKLRNLDARLARVSAILEELGGELDPPDDNRGGDTGRGNGAPGGDGGSEGAGGGLGRGGDNDSNREGEARIERQRIKLTRQKRNLVRQVETQKLKVQALGVLVVEVEVIEETPDEVIVWAHDMWIEQGKTYRYRLSMEVYNPVFARKLQLPENQHERADDITVSSAPSEWTLPIETDEWLKVFVTQAHSASSQQNNLGKLGLGDARAEVFRFLNGRWWRETFSVEPGDQIGEVRGVSANGRGGGNIQVDFSTNWYLLDVIETVDSDNDMKEKGLAAQAMLQGLDDASRLMLRDPNQEYRNRLYQRLREEVELAELASEFEGATSN